MESSTTFFFAYFSIVLIISAAVLFFWQSIGNYDFRQTCIRVAIPASFLIAMGLFALYESRVDRSQLKDFLLQAKTCTVQIRPLSPDGAQAGNFLCKVDLPPEIVAALARAVDQTGAVALTHAHSTEGVRIEFFNEAGTRCDSFLMYHQQLDGTQQNAVRIENVSIGAAAGASGRRHDPVPFGGLLNQIVQNSKCSSEH